VLDPGFRAEVGVDGILFLHDATGARRAAVTDLDRPDPVRLEVFGNRFMSIAEQMGAVLRNTSVSTNIKERLDYSCAVFDAEGGLVANAPHIPVHLGAMSETVRVVFSDPRFICNTTRVWHDFEFYGKAGFKTAWLRRAFADHETEFHLSIRNPAGFLAELLRFHAPMTLEDHLRGADPGTMFWSEVIGRIRAANPDTPITVWCHEDTPVIWPLVLAAVAGVEADVPMAGSDAIVRPLLTEAGRQSLASALGDPVAIPAAQTVEALERHLELYADPDQLHDEIDIPGWDDVHVEAMTLAYEADLERIAATEGVAFLRPEATAELFDTPLHIANIF